MAAFMDGLHFDTEEDYNMEKHYEQQMMEEADEDEDEEEYITGALAVAGLLVHGSEEARRLRAEERSHHRLYLTRSQLLPNPRMATPWLALYTSQNNRAFITTMGFDVATFQSLLDDGFEELWNSTPIPRNDVSESGTPRIARRSLDAAGALGLLLHFLNSTMVETSLVEIFAIIPTTVSRYITFALDLLLVVLRAIPDSRIKWPSGDEFQENNYLVVARHPLLTGAFGSMDGLNLAVQTSADQEIENATYNGWLHEHFVSSVLAFGATGEIIASVVNAPGSWHDARVAQPIFKKLRDQTPEGYYLVTDTAFPRGTSQILGRIRAPLKAGASLPNDPTERAAIKAFDRQLLSFRQTAEWGNRGIQGTFGRLRVPLQINYADNRANILECCNRLFNLRTRKVGLNQIRAVYMPIWKRDQVQRDIWNHFEDMLFSTQRENDRVLQYYIHGND